MACLPLPFAAFLAGVLSFLSPCVVPLVPQSKSAFHALLMGLAFGFAWTPCVGPILATGITFLMLDSLGLGLPFIATSFGVNRFLASYGRIRPLLRSVEVVGGAVLIVVGVLVFTHYLTTINSRLNDVPFVRRAAELVL